MYIPQAMRTCTPLERLRKADADRFPAILAEICEKPPTWKSNATLIQAARRVAFVFGLDAAKWTAEELLRECEAAGKPIHALVMLERLKHAPPSPPRPLPIAPKQGPAPLDGPLTGRRTNQIIPPPED